MQLSDTQIEPPCPRAFSPAPRARSSRSPRRPRLAAAPQTAEHPVAHRRATPRSRSKAPSNPATKEHRMVGRNLASTTQTGAAIRAPSGHSRRTPGPTPSKSTVTDEEGDPAKFLLGATRYYVRLVRLQRHQSHLLLAAQPVRSRPCRSTRRRCSASTAPPKSPTRPRKSPAASNAPRIPTPPSTPTAPSNTSSRASSS